MKGERLEVVRGSGNVFRDVGHKDADVKQCKAILAAEIIKALDCQGLSVRAAHDRTGVAAADFSRIRNANLELARGRRLSFCVVTHLRWDLKQIFDMAVCRRISAEESGDAAVHSKVCSAANATDHDRGPGAAVVPGP